MIPVWQINRHGLFWLLIAFAGVIVIHIEHLPSWVLVASVAAIIWRIQQYRGVWPHPGSWVKLLLLLLCIAGLFIEYGKPVGLEPMVALLVSAFTLKLLEIHSKRDAMLVVYLAFFIAIIQALFDQTIIGALYIAGCLVMVTVALVGLHQGGADQQLLRPLRISAILLLQAIPLMLLLFVIMPRLGSFWSVPIPSHGAKTGMSDSMSPGDFSRLGRSGELAFRVSFEGKIPPQRALYWRGMTLSDFDGRRWENATAWGEGSSALFQRYGDSPQQWDQSIDRNGDPLSYTVLMEPTQQQWLYALATPLPASPSVALTRDFRLVAEQLVTAKKQYQVKSWLDHSTERRGLSGWRRLVETRIPEGYNPRTLALARRWQRQTPDAETLIRRVLGLYNREFVYSLRPPRLGKHSVDEFLFDTQRGFCEYFASSFVFFMRAAGVPARVVVGYQGGERHPDGYLMVRQYDAHAWAEVWVKGRGWVRVDPTAAVAPERIEASFGDVLGDQEGFLADSPLSLMKIRHIPLLNRLRLQLESLNYSWVVWVLGYDSVQYSFLEKLLGEHSPTRIGLAFLTVAGSIMGLLAVLQLRNLSGQSHDELDRLFLRFCRKLEKAGLVRKTGEGPRAFAERVARQRPELAGEVAAINQSYESIRYGDASWKRLATIKRAVRGFKVPGRRST